MDYRGGTINYQQKTISKSFCFFWNIFVIFPEGTRTKDGNLLEFKKGTAIFGIDTKIPIVPIAISGSYNWSQKKIFDLSKSVITFEFSEPIITENLAYDDRDRLTEQIKASIEQKKID